MRKGPSSTSGLLAKSLSVLSLVSIVSIVSAAWVASAQQTTERPYELSIEGASFLPHRISRVKEILKGVDLRASLPTGKGKFEVDAFLANAEGTSYRALSFDYRADLGFEAFPAFVLVGLNADVWVPPAPHDQQFYSGGWHFGGGFFQPLAGGFALREDFRYRFGPGTSLIIGLGLNYQFSN